MCLPLVFFSHLDHEFIIPTYSLYFILLLTLLLSPRMGGKDVGNVLVILAAIGIFGRVVLLLYMLDLIPMLPNGWKFDWGGIMAAGNSLGRIDCRMNKINKSMRDDN